MANKIYFPIRRTMYHPTKAISPQTFECENEAAYNLILKDGWSFNPNFIKKEEVVEEIPEPVNEDVVEAEAETIPEEEMVDFLEGNEDDESEPWACDIEGCDFVGKSKRSLRMHKLHGHKER